VPATAAASLVRMGRVTCIAHAGQLAYPMWRKVKDQIKAVRAQLEDGAQVRPGLAALVCARARSASRHSAQAKPSRTAGGRTPATVGGGLSRSPARHAVRSQAATRLQALVDVLTQSFKEGNAGAAQVGAARPLPHLPLVASH
jgi:hypothetical protein